MKVYKKEVTVYELDGKYEGFIVETSKGDDEMIDVYLTHKRYGIKDFMFGFMDKYEGYTLEGVIYGNLEGSIKLYIEKFMDEDVEDIL